MIAPTTSTSWARVGVLVAAGVFAAFHIGKVPGQLVALTRELQLSLTQAGALVALFNLIAALFGVALGLLVDRIGALRSAVIGLTLGGCASILASFAPGFGLLAAMRAVEGVGFILTVSSIPSILVGEVDEKDRRKTLGVWGAYMPAGFATSMAASGLIGDIGGWRLVWQVVAGFGLVWAGVLWAVFRHRAAAAAGGALGRASLSSVAQRNPLLLAGAFVGYAGHYLAVMSFLPLLLTQQAGFSARGAAGAVALVVSMNIIGNVASGFIVDAGVTRKQLVVAASLIMAACSLAIFTAAPPFAVKYAAALILSAVGGLIPGALFGAAPFYAERPAMVSTIIGLLLQSAGIGQLIGPVLLAGAVERSGGWQGALWYALPSSALAIFCALLLRRPANAR
jgi:predicted MFS family arabinose efflux permease